MVEFLFTEDNNSVDSAEQSSENFCDISTINVKQQHITFPEIFTK